MQPAQDGLHDPFVPRLGSADEVVIGQVELSGYLFPDCSHFVTPGLRALAGAQCACCTFCPAHPGQSEKKPPHPGCGGPGDDIGNDFFVGVAEMRLAVDVVNGCRDENRFPMRGLTVEEQGRLATARHGGRRARNTCAIRIRSTPAAPPSAARSQMRSTAPGRLQPRRTSRCDSMIVVADVEGRPNRTQDHHPHQIDQRHGEDEQRLEKANTPDFSSSKKWAGSTARRADSRPGGCRRPQKDAGLREIVRQKAEQRSRADQRDQRDQVLPRGGRR